METQSARSTGDYTQTYDSRSVYGQLAGVPSTCTGTCNKLLSCDFKCTHYSRQQIKNGHN